MPDANGFWNAAEQQQYRQSGDSGEAPGTTPEQRQANLEQLYGTQTYTDPTGKAVRGWEGSWQHDPLAGRSGGALWMPGQAGVDWGQGSASRANPAGMSTFLRDIAPDTFGAGSNILSTMQGRNLYGGAYNPGGQYTNPTQFSPPGMSGADPNSQFAYIMQMMQSAPEFAGMANQATGPDAFNSFNDWFSGKTNWDPGSGVVDTTGLAPWNPATGQSTGGPVSFGDLYQQQGVGPPVVGNRGQSFLPGYQNLGTGYNTQLMQQNPGLFMAELQQQQMQNPGQSVSGTPSPWLPPQLSGGQPMGNPAPMSYAQQGIHQGPGAFGSPGGQASQPMRPTGPMSQPMTSGGQHGAPGHPTHQTGQAPNIQAGGQQQQQQQQLMSFLSSLFGGGGTFGNPLASNGGAQNLQGVAQLLSFIQMLRGQYGGVPGFQQRPPAFGGNGMFRGGSNYLYPMGYGPRSGNGVTNEL